ncbi:Glycerol-3-phosphate dehydrogenase, NAD-dependent [Parasponia andersonii]|uniref:Glycerol-3-phosphate dehydrogenase [NAD(+)] n=1 Tax=Parasponia andersonii TaxID=3476 RepID=A0A2P5CTJ1_PARAD|nr:Glycerol-3-phosphate dehydrogenase, NAD-dependent [Parasponia andersonii]
MEGIARFNTVGIVGDETCMLSPAPRGTSSSLLTPYNISNFHLPLSPFHIDIITLFLSLFLSVLFVVVFIFVFMAPAQELQHDQQAPPPSDEAPYKSRVTIVGSGNWGSVASKLIASNTLRLNSFHDEVRMWVYEEILPSGEKLTEVINRTNENVKYLPGIKLGRNVVADPDLENAVKDANMLVFVTPHQFMEGICGRLVGKVRGDVEAISLIKGMEVKMEGPCMISTLISQQLGLNCCVLMGANIANEIAVEKFSEATVGYRVDRDIAEKWVQLFSTPFFIVTAVQDVEGVELCGTLKNVVAIAAGFVDGLEMGNNTKAAIMRIGLREMKAFSKLLFSSVKDTTFFESCGVADLITTCLGGRNRKVAEAFAKNGGKRSFDELEAEMLQGQKLQGVSTAKEVYEVLSHRGWLDLFPLFATVHEISIGRLPPSAIVEHSERKPKFSLADGSI